ncbi:hypothetical protein [Aquipuribacter nitratireducens]|uniref:C-type lysozyme inhibitor domain-containing protein n=1 Tax=Aquipuribacter nitratireducens TaxID=650104 RepID=A0ABW0GPY4_9MICO
MAVGALALTPVAAQAAEPPRPHERTLTWTCTDGTTFTTARPSFAANGSPVVGSTQVWLQVETTITRADGTTTVDPKGGGRLDALAGELLDCSTTSGTNTVRVLGLLTG